MSHRYQQSADYDTPYHSVGGGYGQHQQQDFGSSANLAGKGYGGSEHTYPASKGATAMGRKPWYKRPIVLWGVPIALVAIIAAAVAGGVIASKNSNDDSSSSGSSSSGRGGGIQNNAAGSLDATGINCE